jgi:hypothetical protein
MWYVVLRGRPFNIVLNVHAPSKEKRDDSKYRIYDEQESILDHFLRTF